MTPRDNSPADLDLEAGEPDPVYDISFTVLKGGKSAVLVTYPDEMADSLDGPFMEDNGFKGCPSEPGHYEAKAVFWFVQGYCDGYPADGESDWGYNLAEIRRLQSAPRTGEAPATGPDNSTADCERHGEFMAKDGCDERIQEAIERVGVEAIANLDEVARIVNGGIISGSWLAEEINRLVAEVSRYRAAQAPEPEQSLSPATDAEAAEIIHDLIGYLPKTVVTHDMGTCSACQGLTSSGMHRRCEKCLRKAAKATRDRLRQPPGAKEGPKPADVDPRRILSETMEDLHEIAEKAAFIARKTEAAKKALPSMLAAPSQPQHQEGGT